jgi:hypothetical protein
LGSRRAAVGFLMDKKILLALSATILVISFSVATAIAVSGPHSVTGVSVDSPTSASPAYVRPGYDVTVQFDVTTDAAGPGDIEIRIYSGATIVGSKDIYNFSFESGLNANLYYDITISPTATDGPYDLRVRARQPAGTGTWVTDTETGAVVVDSVPPTVVSVTVNDSLLTDADVGAGKFTVTIDYSEAMDTTAPTIAFDPAVATTLTFNAGLSGWSDSDTYAAVYDVADGGVKVDDVDILVSGAKDLAGNTQESYTKTAAFDIDTQNPTVVSATAVPDPAKAGTVTVTVVFSEAMDTAVSPTVTVTGLTSSPYTVTKTSYVGDTWIGTFTLLDQDEEKTATISVSGAQDLAANVMTAAPAAGTFDVDTVTPTVVSAITTSTTTIDVVFSEELDPATLEATNFTVTGYTVTDATLSVDGLTVTLTVSEMPTDETPEVNYTQGTLADLAGNLVADFTIVAEDGVAPTVVSATAVPDPAKAGTVTVTVVFSEAMDTAVSPTVTVTGLKSSPYSVTQTSYSETTWVGTFTLADDDEVATATISVSGAKDLAGNEMDPAPNAGTFDVDTVEPRVVSITTVVSNEEEVPDNLISDYDYEYYFGVVVTFSEAMDPASELNVTFDPNVVDSGTLTFDSVEWRTDNTAIIWYWIDDVNEEVAGVDVSVSGATDLAGNLQITATWENLFDVDTLNPTAVSAITTSTTTIDVVFSEELDPATVNAGDFAVSGYTVTDATLSENGLTVTLTVSEMPTDETPEVNYTQGTLADLAGNPAEGGPIMAVDGVAPTISNLTASPDPFSPWIPDGVKDSTTISFTLSESVYGIMRIENETGGVVGQYVAPEPVGPGPMSAPWEGRDENGVLVPVGTYTIYIEATDMAGNKSMAWTTVRVESSIYVSLSAGWNLISLPLIPDNSSIENVLAPIMDYVEIVWYYDASTGNWLVYTPGPAPDDLTTMEAGKGYWIKMKASATLTVYGVQIPPPPAVPPTYMVVPGWNLIGFKSISSMTANEYLASVAGKWASLWTFDPAIGTYVKVFGSQNMLPGRGYWIYMTEAGEIAP